ncbi:hypothetical protein C2G38_2033157 [Gigaspora rosea]|uniref:Uncharacterized protein n=1 Tax=Gigaspora rosea TaxID=44941 RepID=A0A397VVA4_9GLOM|nr:hypothetical protein C2G38_2033157 [Gigaspora rosea]
MTPACHSGQNILNLSKQCINTRNNTKNCDYDIDSIIEKQLNQSVIGDQNYSNQNFESVQRENESFEKPKDSNKLVEIISNNIALRNRAETYIMTESLADLNKSLEIDPNDPITLNHRGVTYQKTGRYEKYAGFSMIMMFIWGENMTFCGKDIKTRIHPNAEKNKNVLDILDSDGCIHILKDLTITKQNLLHGCYLSSDGTILRAQNQAFKFKNPNKVVAMVNIDNADLKDLIDEEIEYMEKNDETFLKNYNLKINANIPLPYVLPSQKFGIKIENSSEKQKQTAKLYKSYKYRGIYSAKCSINILHEIEPIKEFIIAVEDALSQNTDKKKIEIN